MCDAEQRVVLPVVTRYYDVPINKHPYGTTTPLFGRSTNAVDVDVDLDLMIHKSMLGIKNLLKCRTMITASACSVRTNVLSIRGGNTNRNNNDVPVPATDSTTTDTTNTDPTISSSSYETTTMTDEEEQNLVVDDDDDNKGTINDDEEEERCCYCCCWWNIIRYSIL